MWWIILLVFVFFLQYAIIIGSLVSGGNQYTNKKDVRRDIIPFYWVFYLFYFLFFGIKEAYKKYKTLE